MRALAAPVIPGAEERWVEVDGVRVRYLFRAGPSAGIPILLVHGLLGFSYSWRHNIAALSEIAPVYALDLPGVGYSERPAKFDCSLAGQAEFLLRFATELHIDKFDLVGSSHGGGIAIMAAAADLRRHGVADRHVQRLVLVSSVNPWSAGRRWLTAVLGTRVGWMGVRGIYPLLGRINAVLLRRMYGDPERMEADAARNYAVAASLPGTRDHFGQILKTWKRDIAGLESALARIRELPTLLVWGTRDTAVLPSSAEPLAKCFDHVEITIIEGAGHLPNEERPEEFNAAVGKFLVSSF